MFKKSQIDFLTSFYTTILFVVCSNEIQAWERWKSLKEKETSEPRKTTKKTGNFTESTKVCIIVNFCN